MRKKSAQEKKSPEKEIQTLMRSLNQLLSDHFCSTADNPLGWAQQKPAFVEKYAAFKKKKISSNPALKQHLQSVETSFKLLDTLTEDTI